MEGAAWLTATVPSASLRSASPHPVGSRPPPAKGYRLLNPFFLKLMPRASIPPKFSSQKSFFHTKNAKSLLTTPKKHAIIKIIPKI